MRQSKLFTKTRRESPKDEIAKNAQLLVRAGYIFKEMAGVYSYLPLGYRVLSNIIKVIREEMDAIGSQEMVMTALQDKSTWEKTDRWDDSKVDNWFKTTLKSGGETGLAITHEEPLTRIMTDYISSYRDLPVYAYQFQIKFRNEMRAKSGIMRGKEFMMKDLYSFSRNEDEHKEFYEKAKEAYRKIFNRLGVGDYTYTTFASGGIFSRFSEEFQTVSEAGEDIIYIDEASGVAVNKEVLSDDVLSELGLDKDKLVEKKAIEVGNVFNLGTKFSSPIGLNFMDESGESKPVIMGSYGLGPTRLMGTIVELLSDEKGIVWPLEVAPFKIHIVGLFGGDNTINPRIKSECEKLYKVLQEDGIEVMYDDREGLSVGEKLNDSDLIGIPWRVIISEKSLNNDKVEVKRRSEKNPDMLSLDEVVDYLKNKIKR